MKRTLLAVATALFAAFSLGLEGNALAEDGGGALPRPAALEPNVQFWIRIYTEVGTDGGLIHDARNLDVIYEVIQFPKGQGPRSRERHVERARARIRKALRTLSRGKRENLNAEEARILALWPEGVSNSSLRAAASRIRFQLGQADKFRAGLIRSGAWLPHIRRTFEEMDLPADLAALPHVESSYTPYAYSRAGAAGLWQFTRSTGHRFMRIDHVVDERLDPFKSTLAAARLLQQNFQVTGSWPLAITAYNHGASGIRRAVRRMGTRDIATIVQKYKSRTFGFASRNFYVEFLAAREIATDPERYFGPLVMDAPVPHESYELPWFAASEALEETLGVPVQVLKQSNPALRPSVWNGTKRIPRGFELRVPRHRLASPIETLMAEFPTTARFASQTRDSFHRVRRGEALSTIAARYHVSIRELAAVNGLRNHNRIRAGQLLRLPDAEGRRHATRSQNRRHMEESAASPADGVYTVRRGDTLSRIADRFGLDETQLMAQNELRDRDRIYVGQRLRLSGEPTAPAAASPLETTSDDAPHPEAFAELTLPRALTPMIRETRAASSKPGDQEGQEEEEEEEQTELYGPTLLADPSDYSVTSEGTIEVQIGETLGHYAEWLDLRASRLRTINHMRYGTPLVVGEFVLLEFSHTSPEQFEQRRLEYHRALQEAFFARFEIEGSTTHVTRRGDSLWTLAEHKYHVPLWLLRQYNPDVDFGALQAGMRITIPRLRERESWQEDS